MVKSFENLDKKFLLNRGLEIFSGLIFLLDHKGTYLDYHADEELLFAPPESFLGKKITDIMPRKSGEKQMAYLRKTFETKEDQTYKLSLKIGGKIKHFIANYVYYDQNSVLSFVQDITELKKVETDLKESEELYHHLFENAPISIFLFDEKGYYLEVNHVAEKMFGYKREELIGNKFQDFGIVSDEAIPKLEKRLKNLFSGENLEPIEFRASKKDGKRVWIRSTVSLITLSKRKVAMVISQDITEKKRAEQELKKLNQLKSELLRRTSHELKTPLVSIKGFADLLLELFKEKMNTRMIELIKEINHGCYRLQELIRDILKTAELESGNLKVDKSKENLSKLVIECVNELKGFAELRGHKIKTELEQDLFVFIEKEHIHQVISNLLTNAIKYTPKGGLISIKLISQNEKVYFSITDTGIGLTENEKSKIFQQFGKIEHFGQGFDIISEGSGLGLYISKQIIDLHGGKIWMESEGRKKGSTFHFTLPKNS
jgi:PAS domain S-box-containing protein